MRDVVDANHLPFDKASVSHPAGKREERLEDEWEIENYILKFIAGTKDKGKTKKEESESER